MRKTVLIFGVSSFVGSNLVEAFRKDYRLMGTYLHTPVVIPGMTTIKCDVLKKDHVQRLVSILKPDITIYAAGMPSLTQCHQNPKLADALNSAGLINVCTSAERYGSKFIFISSSFVLGGEDTLYHESDTPFPSTVYGASLASSEFYVQRSCLNYLILRLCPFYGRAFHPLRKNWLEHCELALSLGRQVTLDDHVAHGHLDVRIFARILKMSIETGVTNRLFQISSKDVSTRYEFLKKFCAVFGYDENLVMRGMWTFPLDDAQFRNKPLERYNFQMDVKNAEDFFGFKLPTIEESLRATKKRLAS